MITRILMIEIRGNSRTMVDRTADLLADHIKIAATFVQAAVEGFAVQEGRTADVQPVLTPAISVSTVLIHGSGPENQSPAEAQANEGTGKHLSLHAQGFAAL